MSNKQQFVYQRQFATKSLRHEGFFVSLRVLVTLWQEEYKAIPFLLSRFVPVSGNDKLKFIEHCPPD
jgi:hypothetical protein